MRRISAAVALAPFLAAAPAHADPLVVAPVTADVGDPTRLQLEGFPPGRPVQVQISPHDDLLGTEITVSHVRVDGSGRATVTFRWPAGYQHCEQDGINVTCHRRAWRTPSQADISAGTEKAPLVSNLASVRLQPQGALPPDLTAAQRFRPLLEFDSSERWRPLQIERLFAASTPMRCAIGTRGCDILGSPTALDVPVIPSGFLPTRPMYLDWPGYRQNPNSYHSPDPACVRGGLLDCDGGAGSAIYVHDITPAYSAERYLDYWWFLRFNHAPGQRFFYDEHEGDWEGVTVALRAGPTPRTFDYVGFAAHAGVWRYLHDVLKCEDPASRREIPCDDAHPAQRVKVFVADGTHAAYPIACGRCTQNPHWGIIPLPEGGFDGKRPWANNYVPGALQPFPVTWTDWQGNWNLAPEQRVPSPGAQKRYTAPWATSCTTRFSINQLGCIAAASRPDTPACESWLGPFTAAAACDPDQLSQALRQGTLGSRGSLAITLAGSRSAGAPGIAQAVGGALGPGQTLRVTGSAGANTQLLVHAEDRRTLLTVRYTRLGLRSGGVVTVHAAHAGGRLTLRATSPTGATLGPTNTLRESTRRPARPRRVRARRQGRRIRVTLIVRTPSADVQLRRRRRGAALSARVVRLHRRGRQTIAVPGRRRARFVTVAAISRGGLPSRPVTVRIRR